MVLWGVVAFCSLMGFKLGEYRVVPDLPGLQQYAHCNALFTKHRIFEAMIQAYQKNQESLRVKTRWARRSQYALLALVAWLMIVVLARIWL